MSTGPNQTLPRSKNKRRKEGDLLGHRQTIREFLLPMILEACVFALENWSALDKNAQGR